MDHGKKWGIVVEAEIRRSTLGLAAVVCLR